MCEQSSFLYICLEVLSLFCRYGSAKIKTMSLATDMTPTPKIHPLPCYTSISSINGPIVVVDKVQRQCYGEIVTLRLGNGEIRTGKVLECHGSQAVLQVFEGTEGLDIKQTSAKFTGEVMKIGVSRALLGRTLSGAGEIIDGGAPVLAEEIRDIEGSSLNPVSREYPKNCLETGISTIDILTSICQGQKILLLSGSGLPYNPLLAQIARNARVCVPWEKVSTGGEVQTSEDDKFMIVFAGIGLSHEQAMFFKTQFEQTGALNRSVILLNLASDPVVQRISTPRIAVTIAEYFAYTLGYHVLVLLSDIFNYADALRQISSARNEVPGRKGYPPYLYSDLSTIYERAGRVRGIKGSITQIPLITLPNDDITHIIADLSAFITEGQIFQDRKLFNKNIVPAVDPLPSLSRLQKSAIGKGRTREDHPDVANQLYASYAIATEVLSLKSIVGSEGLSDNDHKYLKFLEVFEEQFLRQDFNVRRSIYESLDLAWKCLRVLPINLLSRISDNILEKYYYVQTETVEQEGAKAKTK